MTINTGWANKNGAFFITPYRCNDTKWYGFHQYVQ